MTKPLRSGRTIAVLAVTAVASLGAAGAALAVGSIPPATVLKPGTASPVTFVATPYGKGVKQGAALPAGTTVTRQSLNQNIQDSTSFNIDQPAPGQFIVSAVAQLVTGNGTVLKSWNGTFVPSYHTPVFIAGQTTSSDAGVLVTIPQGQRVPAGSKVVLYALFRKGAKPSAP